MIPKKNTFCIAPFNHAMISPQGDLKVCCVSKETSDFKYYDIEKWYDSDKLKNLRNNLIKGIKDPICKSCWVQEENQKISQRQVYNKHLGGILEEHWEKSFKKNKNLPEKLQNQNAENITAFDLKLGNHCNLKCIMCSPVSSSELLLEAKKNKKLSKYYDLPDSREFTWAKEEKFKNWCSQYISNTTHIKFTGGEPFLNPFLLEVLRNIKTEQKKKCILHFTTNLTVINERIFNALKDFKETWWSVSMEGIGKVLEYARFGHTWKDLEKNLEILMSLQSNKSFIHVNHVVQSPTFRGIKKLVDWCDSKKLLLDPIFLTNPKVFRLQSIKTNYKKEFIQSFKGYNGHNQNFVKSVSTFVSNNLDHDLQLAKKCVERLKSFDKVRNTNFQDIIPIDYFI